MCSDIISQSDTVDQGSQGTEVSDDSERFRLVKAFAALCRQDAYGTGLEYYDHSKQRRRISYKKRVEPLGDAQLLRHLNDGPYVAIYPYAEGSSQTWFAAFDIDDHDGVMAWEKVGEAARRVCDAARQHGLQPWVLRSGGGRGIHIYAIWDQAQPGADVRNLARAVLAEAGFREGTTGLDNGTIEIFPKEPGVQRGHFGTLLAAPFGRNSVPLDENFQPLDEPQMWDTSLPVAVSERTVPLKREVKKREPWSDDDVARLRSALKVLPADNRDEWVKYGHAIKHDLGDERGWPVWHQWSMKSREGYKGESDCWKTWQTLDRSDRDDGMTTASIFKAALDAGWEEPDRLVVRPGLHHEAAESAMKRLVAADAAIYQRVESLVRVARVPALDFEGHKIAIPAIVSFTKPLLSSEMAKAVKWYEFDRAGKLARIEPKPAVVDKVHDAVGHWPFPPLRGIIATPTMRPDGTLLTEVGYDAATGYMLFEPPVMPHIPEQPTRDDAEAALALLNGLLVEFPFSTEAGRSVALSAILTTVVRAALDAVPIHVFDAPTPGTGKSYLSALISRIATGERTAPVSATEKNAGENEKRLSAAALTGAPIIAIDNCSSLNFGPFLDTATTEPRAQIRILGKSENKLIDNTFTVLVNGNNVQIAADRVRRTIKCRLDANMERPEMREFQGDPEAEILADRGRYVAAALTIVRAYVVAGCPEVSRRPGFSRWSRYVRSALVWLGCADPVDSTADIVADDPQRQKRVEVFEAIATAGLLERPVMTKDIIKAAYGSALRNTLLQYFSQWNGDDIDPARFGNWLHQNADQIADGYKLRIDRSDKKRPRWLLTDTEPHEERPADPDEEDGLPNYGDPANETRF